MDEQAVNQEERVKKKLSVDETNNTENNNNDLTPKSQLQKSMPPIDKAYDGIRGHERHILFHFFTLFSISFIIGVLFIHLSLWMSSFIFASAQSAIGGVVNELESYDNSKEFNSGDNVDVKQDTLWNLAKTAFQYTGIYFEYHSYNISKSLIATE